MCFTLTPHTFTNSDSELLPEVRRVTNSGHAGNILDSLYVGFDRGSRPADVLRVLFWCSVVHAQIFSRLLVRSNQSAKFLAI